MKAKSLISILLGSLILVNIVHNILPHHHHMDDLPSQDGCHQHDEGDHAGDADDPSGHCHAFNGVEYVLSFEQYSSFQPAQMILGYFAVPVSLADESPSQDFPSHRARGPSADCPGFLGETSGLRAPPSIS